MKYLTILSLAMLLACQPSQQKEKSELAKPTYQVPDHHSASLTQIFEAHGGYEQWSKMKSLSYTKGEESTITNLQNRKIRLESPQQTIGFDGENVWVTPDTVDASRARFYHNLYFYFYAMPFVVGDPGAYYEDVEPRELNGKMYNGIKVSYAENIGDAPDDNYILWIDPETNKMEWLMYTVTYRSGEPSDKYSLINYNQWEETNGLVLPKSLVWYTYNDGQIGEQRSEAVFENVNISEEVPSEELFEMPDNAQIAPMNAE